MTNPHVLLVDDDRTILALLGEILAGAGYRVSSACDGHQAYEVFTADHPDLVLTDLRMPEMDGRELVEVLLRESPETTVLVLTGHGTVEEAVALMRTGVYSILTKPVKIDDLLFMVEKALEDKRLRAHNRELERRLEISERLAMIGKLAAGVAHELNNPLDGVMRFVKLSLESLPQDGEIADFLTEALQGLSRMSSIIKDLLTFSRNIVLEVEEERIETLLREAARQVTAPRDDIRAALHFDLAVPDVWVPRGMFQVFQNLVKNAVDAIGEGGRIDLQAGIRNGEVFVAVRDDGAGIPKEVRDRVFEPFFTTKPPGQGTGLGLSIVSRIMERFKGGVRIESEEGKGTTVTVFLPASSYATRGESHDQG